MSDPKNSFAVVEPRSKIRNFGFGLPVLEYSDYEVKGFIKDLNDPSKTEGNLRYSFESNRISSLMYRLLNRYDQITIEKIKNLIHAFFSLDDVYFEISDSSNLAKSFVELTQYKLEEEEPNHNNDFLSGAYNNTQSIWLPIYLTSHIDKLLSKKSYSRKGFQDPFNNNELKGVIFGRFKKEPHEVEDLYKHPKFEFIFDKFYKWNSVKAYEWLRKELDFPEGDSSTLVEKTLSYFYKKKYSSPSENPFLQRSEKLKDPSLYNLLFKMGESIPENALSEEVRIAFSTLKKVNRKNLIERSLEKVLT